MEIREHADPQSFKSRRQVRASDVMAVHPQQAGLDQEGIGENGCGSASQQTQRAATAERSERSDGRQGELHPRDRRLSL